MLRFLQERVNKATKKLDAMTPEQIEQLEQTDGQEHQKLSGKQGRVKDLMRRLAVKLGKENDVEEGK
jgi:hypothetical protein